MARWPGIKYDVCANILTLAGMGVTNCFLQNTLIEFKLSENTYLRNIEIYGPWWHTHPPYLLI